MRSYSSSEGGRLSKSLTVAAAEGAEGGGKDLREQRSLTYGIRGGDLKSRGETQHFQSQQLRGSRGRVNMRPMVLKGHSRPIVCVKYNADGDLLFTSSRGIEATVWRTNNGERLGTYTGHQGAVYSMDLSKDSTRMITASADNSAIMWDVETGKELFKWEFNCPLREACISPDGKRVAIVKSMLMSSTPEVHILPLSEDPSMLKNVSLQILKGPEQTIRQGCWTATGEDFVGVCEDGTVRKWNVQTTEQTHNIVGHKKSVMDISMSPDGLQFITASSDTTAKLWDVQDMTVLKTYKSDRPVNAADISPLMDHVLLGGGQDASEVTTSGDRENFFSIFFHKIYEEELCSVRGHFGPINAVRFSPDGRQFVSGSEESFVRLHNMDEEYFTRRYD